MPAASVNGIRINYGVEGGGEPLLLIMGFGATRMAWLLQRLFFRKHFKVISFDNRGTGRSDKPAGPYTVKDMADDAAGLLDHLEIESAHVVGVSMGGMIAQELAIRHPDKMRKLVLGCTFACADQEGGIAPELLRAMGFAGDAYPDETAPVPIEKSFRAVVSNTFNSPLYRLTTIPLTWFLPLFIHRDGLAAQQEAITGHDTRDRLGRIKAPTLVMCGTDDRIISPSSSDTLAGRIPNSKLVKIDGGSHAFMAERAKRFNREVLAFLKI